MTIGANGCFMVALGFLQFVSSLTHQVGHTLKLIFADGFAVGPVTVNVVPWLDHFALKVWLNIP